jgi:hypothetical protein
VKLAPPITASLFDLRAPAPTSTAAPDGSEEDDEPFVEIEGDEPVDDTEALDDAACAFHFQCFRRIGSDWLASRS